MVNIPPEIFDRRRRRGLRERAGRRGGHLSFLWEYIADDLAERLGAVSRNFDNILIIGPLATQAETILAGRHGSVQVAVLSDTEILEPGWFILEEDRVPFPPESFDLIICAGTLDSVNDLPGALVQMRRSLRPDGLFLGHMFGAGTLGKLKTAMLQADANRTAAHIHPQIDLRSTADLLSRAGFALPVADFENMTVRYSDWRRLVDDLRDLGIGNALAGPRNYIGKQYPARLDAAWSAAAETDSKVSELFMHIHISGWAPSPDQPKPARRGSGVSLAQILPQSHQTD